MCIYTVTIINTYLYINGHSELKLSINYLHIINGTIVLSVQKLVYFEKLFSKGSFSLNR